MWLVSLRRWPRPGEAWGVHRGRVGAGAGRGGGGTGWPSLGEGAGAAAWSRAPGPGPGAGAAGLGVMEGQGRGGGGGLRWGRGDVVREGGGGSGAAFLAAADAPAGAVSPGRRSCPGQSWKLIWGDSQVREGQAGPRGDWGRG